MESKNEYSLMEFFSPLTLFTDALVVLTCMTGDLVLQEPDVTRNIFARAITDSATHGLVAALSWIVVEGVSCQYGTIRNICISGFLGMAIDLDHFIAARSLRLKDALSNTHRPPFHNSSLIPVAMLVALTLNKLNVIPSNNALPMIVLVSVLSHHLRDAHRRGLWFWPLGSTPPLPKAVYLSAVALLPIFVRSLFYLATRTSKKEEMPLPV